MSLLQAGKEMPHVEKIESFPFKMKIEWFGTTAQRENIFNFSLPY